MHCATTAIWLGGLLFASSFATAADKAGVSTAVASDLEMADREAMKPGEMKPELGADRAPRGDEQPAAAVRGPADEARVDALAARIDALLAEAWAEQGLEPASPATDTRFLRRVTLDLIGRIPRVDEAREFLRDPSPAARRRLVERLLASREHAEYMAAVWHASLLPDVGGSTQLEPWLAERFADGAGYDRIARDIVLAAAKGGGEPTLAQPLDRKPTELAAAVSRTFLGTQIQCAECHKHPTDVWTQDDFWGFAAFFGSVTHPQTKAAVPPRFLGAAEPVDPDRGARPQLADWLASPENPWFAKAAVNRFWGLLFGAGIVHPVDDIGSHNAPVHPGVLDELAGFFATGGWDHRDVLRALTRTRAYGLAGGDGRLFAAMPLEPLSAVQLYNSLATAYQSSRLASAGRDFSGRTSSVEQFLAKFRTAPGQEREYTAGIPRHCILLWMTGGPSQIDTFDMKPGHANGGSFKEIATAVPGMRFSEHLPKLAAHAGSLAILRGLSTKEGDHGRATELMHTGYLPMGPIRYPTLGSSLSKALARGESDLPSFVSVNPFLPYNVGSPGFLGAAHAPLTVGSQAAFSQQSEPTAGYAALTVDDAQPQPTYLARQQTRLDLWRSLESGFLAEHPRAGAVAAHSTVYERAIRFMTGAERALDAFDLSQEPDVLRQAYGRSSFGQGCLLARRLVERGVAFVEVAMNGGDNSLAWDTHQDNFSQVAKLSAELDAGWATLLTDLKERGLLDSTTILWMGEFGRTPKISGGGRDHFTDAWSAVLAGGGIQGGAVHGRTSADGQAVEDGRIEVGDLLATLAAAVGVRPETENLSEMGRPIKIAEGKPVTAVLA